MNKLFVYGIFLDESKRANYGMTKPEYATVPGYLTMGEYIIEAVAIPERPDIALSGLMVDVDPARWPDIDDLEAGYNRIVITTTHGEKAYMYAGKE